MKKLLTAAIVILSVGLAMILVGGVLQGVTWQGNFDGQFLADALSNVGYIVAMLSGVVLTAVGVASAIKGGCCDKDCKNQEKCDKK